MVVRGKDIYKRVAEKNKLNLSLVESIGNAMFQELRTKVDTGTSLAYEMPKLGTFNVRFTKFKETFDRFTNHINKKTPWALELLEKYQDRYNRDIILNKLIDQYREDRKKTRNERYTYTESQDKSKEHKEVSNGMVEIHTIPPEQK